MYPESKTVFACLSAGTFSSTTIEEGLSPAGLASRPPTRASSDSVRICLSRSVDDDKTSLRLGGAFGFSFSTALTAEPVGPAIASLRQTIEAKIQTPTLRTSLPDDALARMAERLNEQIELYLAARRGRFEKP